MSKLDDLGLLSLVGHTPFYKLPLDTGGAEVWIKLEGNNPGGSIKDRAAWGMLKFCEKEGRLKEGGTLVESTSGNTGIGLAMLGKALGLHVIITMPESMSIERRKLMTAFGADLVLTPAAGGMKAAGEKAVEIAAAEKGAFIPNQFGNPGNPWAHETTTGPEIIEQTPQGRKIAAFVAGFGTGGTVTGIGRALRKKFPDVKIIAVEPASSPLLTGGHAGPHKIQGIGANFVPGNLDRHVVTDLMTVKDEDALTMTKRLSAEFGLFSGISTGCNVWAAVETAKKLPKGTIVATVQPDRGDKYLSVF